MTFEFVVCMTEQSSILTAVWMSFFIICEAVLMCVATRTVYLGLVLAVSFSTVGLSRDLEKRFKFVVKEN